MISGNSSERQLGDRVRSLLSAGGLRPGQSGEHHGLLSHHQVSGRRGGEI